MRKPIFLFIKILTILVCFYPLPSFGFIPFLDDDPPHSEHIDRIAKAVSLISQHYYDPTRIQPERMLQEGLHNLAREVPELLVQFVPGTPNQINLSLLNQTKIISYTIPQTLKDIIVPVNEVFLFIHQTYQGEVKEEEREYAVIHGMLKILDPHSNLLTPEVFKEFKTQTEGEYGGIGIVISIKDDELTVISPLEGTPAMSIGVEAEDKILEIDHLPTVNMSLSEAVERLRGKIDTKVKLLLKRKNKDPWEVELTRKQIVIESVKSKLVQINNKNIGIVSLRSFQEDTFWDMEKALNNFLQMDPSSTASNIPTKIPRELSETEKIFKAPIKKQELHGLVIDLRNNPGGLLDQSLEIVDKFLESGDILYTAGANNTQQETTQAVKRQGDLLNIPIIILVNRGSASASEIVSGALKNTNRAIVMGTQTFGKGSVQSVFTLKDKSAIKLTIAQYLTPGKVSIQAIGITPDIELQPVVISKEVFDLKYDETFGEQNLEEHLENSEYIQVTKPIFGLPYVEESKAETQNSEYTVSIDEKTDYPLQLALNILDKAKMAPKEELLKQITPLLEEEFKKQDTKITQALKQFEVNWQASNQELSASPQMTWSSVITSQKDNKEITQIHAGEAIVWNLIATNQGTQKVGRLMGVIESEAGLLDGKEFVFGNIEPGQTKKASLTLNVPEDISSFEELTKIVFYSENKTEISSFTVNTHFIEKPKPHLAYQFHMKDDGSLDSLGNGNQVPEKGEKIAVEVTLQNKSPHLANHVMVNLINKEGDGIYLRQGRSMVGPLQPNESKTINLSFEIAPDFAKDKIELELSIYDNTTQTGLRDKLTVPLTATLPFEPLQDVIQQTPVVTIQEQIVQDNKKTIHIKGEVLDDQNVKDLMIFVGGKKLFYKANQSSQQMTFEAELPLEEGANYIYIQARDNRKLIGAKTLSVMGLPKSELASQTH